MNFYQKIYAAATLLILMITSVVFFICISTPYSEKYIVESIAVFISELVLGLLAMLVAGKTNRIMFHSVGYWICGLFYFCFTLIMSFLIKAEVSFKIFTAIHFIGFLLMVFFLLFFYMSEHNIMQQEKADILLKEAHCGFYNKMNIIHIEAMRCFPDDQNLLRRLQMLVEEFRYAADPSEKNMIQDSEIEAALSSMKELMEEGNKELFACTVEKTERLIKIRKNIL